VSEIKLMLTENDRSQIRREISVAILGIIVGVLTTFFTKLIESEYQYQRSLRVIEYEDDCRPAMSSLQPPYAVRCNLMIRASGLKEIKRVRVAVTAQPHDSTVPQVRTVTLMSSPSFAPPDPPPQIESTGVEGFMAISVPRLRHPQRLTWSVEITSDTPIDVDSQIQRVVSTEDTEARIEEGSAWQWRKWLPLGLLAALIPLIVILLLLTTMWSLRSRPERRTVLWE
jgi:hypothetical protein